MRSASLGCVSFALSALAFMTCPSASHAQGFDGKTVENGSYFPDITTQADVTMVTVGPGSEYTASPFYSVNISDTEVLVTFNSLVAFNPDATFNGYGIKDTLNVVPAITGATIVSETGPFTASRLSFTNDSVLLNFLGLTFAPGDAIRVNVAFAGTPTTAPVPEPAEVATFTALFGSVGFGMMRARRARRRASTKAAA
jgi:hypothetical protein